MIVSSKWIALCFGLPGGPEHSLYTLCFLSCVCVLVIYLRVLGRHGFDVIGTSEQDVRQAIQQACTEMGERYETTPRGLGLPALSTLVHTTGGDAGWVNVTVNGPAAHFARLKKHTTLALSRKTHAVVIKTVFQGCVVGGVLILLGLGIGSVIWWPLLHF